MERLEIKIRPLTNELRYYFTGKTTIDASADTDQSAFLLKSISKAVSQAATVMPSYAVFGRIRGPSLHFTALRSHMLSVPVIFLTNSEDEKRPSTRMSSRAL